MNQEFESVKGRIEKDIKFFNDNVRLVKSEKKEFSEVIELAKMYASDAKSYLDKGDTYTAFSCISYAHGLLDAMKKILNK